MKLSVKWSNSGRDNDHGTRTAATSTAWTTATIDATEGVEGTVGMCVDR